LLLKPGATGSDYRQMPWLIRALSIAHVPSVSSWYAITGVRGSTQRRSGFVAWADPAFGGRQQVVATRGLRSLVTEGAVLGDVETGLLPPNLGELLSPLPETLGEAEAIAGVLGGSSARDVVHGAEATRSSVLSMSKRGELKRRGVVMFATHGLAPSQVSGLDGPALALAQERGEKLPSLLTVEDVLGLELDADWVLLSACNTSSADERGGDPLSGLARGFFYAGARSLLVTHWAVETESAAALTTGAMGAYVEGGVSRSEALRRSMVEVMDRSDGSWSHPVFWAPYALVGL
jgi:CHAT domain-containing protein